jgi:hypothetical protein
VQCRIRPRFKNGDHATVLPRCRKVMVAENRSEILNEVEYNSRGKML